MKVGIARFETGSLGISISGGLTISLSLKCDTELVPRGGIAGLQAGSCVQFRGGIGVAAEFAEGRAIAIAIVEDLGTQAGRLFERGKRFLMIAREPQRDAQVIMRCGKIGIDSQGFAEAIDSFAPSIEDRQQESHLVLESRGGFGGLLHLL